MQNLVQTEASDVAASILSNGLTLVLDQNARVIDGQIYVPNATAIIKDNHVFLP